MTISSYCVDRVASLILVTIIILTYLGLVGFEVPQLLFICYSVLLHIFGAFIPARACWSIWELTKNIQATLSQERYKSIYQQCKTSKGEGQGHFSHVIMVPNYKEDLGTLRDTLLVLASHSQARTTYDVYLAMEEAEKGAQAKASLLILEFKQKFHSINSTLHPKGIPGEAQGKSSNVSWAAKQVCRQFTAAESRQSVVVTIIDADSHLSKNYFAHVAEMHMLHQDTCETTFYVAPGVFDRNAQSVAAFVRVADMLWNSAGLSILYESSRSSPGASVYSLPLTLIDRVGGWDSDDGAITEDVHMYIKCFFAMGGNLTTRIVHSPVSSTNLPGDGKTISSMLGAITARYKLSVRHWWGSLDVGFALRLVSELVRNGLPRPTKEKYMQFVSTNGIKGQTLSHCDGPDTREPVESINWFNILMLMQTLWEAYLLVPHLVFVSIFPWIYTVITTMDEIPPILLWTININSFLRIITISLTVSYFLLYENYHYVCVKSREAEMRAAGLADGMLDSFAYRNFRTNWTDYVLFPSAFVLLGSFPAITSQLGQLWGRSYTFTPSQKPLRARKSSSAGIRM